MPISNLGTKHITAAQQAQIDAALTSIQGGAFKIVVTFYAAFLIICTTVFH